MNKKLKDNTLESLPNIGKTFAQKLREIGIKDKTNFLKQDPYKIFDKLRKKEPALCRCALAGIVGASKGVKWYSITKKTAKEYEKRHPNHKWDKC